MSYTDQDVERVAEAIWHKDYFWNTGVHPDHEDENHIPITWDRESKTTQRWGRSVARAALEAMEREPLEEVLATVKNSVLLEREESRDYPEWHVWLDEKHEGTGVTPSEAIRNAVAVAKGDE